MFQLSVNKLYAVGKLIFLALNGVFFPPNFKYFLRKKKHFLAMADLPRFSRGWESRKKS